LIVESHFELWSFMPWSILIVVWYKTLLVYLKLIPPKLNWSQFNYFFPFYIENEKWRIFLLWLFCCRKIGA
jgi:hypothetical protein